MTFEFGSSGTRAVLLTKDSRFVKFKTGWDINGYTYRLVADQSTHFIHFYVLSTKRCNEFAILPLRGLSSHARGLFTKIFLVIIIFFEIISFILDVFPCSQLIPASTAVIVEVTADKVLH